jgi:flagellar hook-associated protein 1 FlgK
VSGAAQDEEASRALLDNADAWRASVEGVSLDEEMVTLISQQEAYQAAARLIGVADEMMQEILRILP